MNRKGELTNQIAPVIAIDFDTIFSRKPSLLDYVKKDKLSRTFNYEFRELTYRLYKRGYNIYVTSFNPDVLKYSDELWGRFIFYTKIVVHKDYLDLQFNCKNVYKYYIDDVRNIGLFDNAYTLETFKELL